MQMEAGARVATKAPAANNETLRDMLARKKWPKDWKACILYWISQIITIYVSLGSTNSVLYELVFVNVTAVDWLLFILFISMVIASNWLYLICWLRNPGYVEIILGPRPVAHGSQDIELDNAEKHDESEKMGLLKRGVGTASGQHAVLNMSGEDGHIGAHNAEQEEPYCLLCDCTIPERSHHCRQCDRCVAKFDHHCPFVNACVAGRTHKYFVLYCFTQSIVMAWGVCSTWSALEFIAMFFPTTAKTGAPHGAYFVMWNLFVLLTLLFNFIMFGTSFTLFICHVSLVARNMTTYEYIVAMRLHHRRMMVPIEERDDMPFSPNYSKGLWKNILEDLSDIKPEYLYGTRRTRHNTWDGTDDIEIDAFDADLDDIRADPLD